MSSQILFNIIVIYDLSSDISPAHSKPFCNNIPDGSPVTRPMLSGSKIITGIIYKGMPFPAWKYQSIRLPCTEPEIPMHQSLLS